MKRKAGIIKRILVLTLISLLFLSTSSLVGSARTLEDINRELEEASRQRGELERQEGDLVTQLTDTDRRLGVLQADIDVLNDQLKVVQGAKGEAESELFKKQAELTVAEEKLAKQTSVLEKRLVDVYKRGSVGYLELLVGSANFDDLLSRLYYLGRIVTQDKKLLVEVKEIKEEVEEERDVCEAKRQEILARQRAIEDIKKPLDIKQREIAEEKNYKQYLIGQVQYDQAAKDQLIAQLIAEEQAAYERARGIGDGGTAPNPVTGFVWPAGNRDLVPPDGGGFGYRWHPITGDWRMHNGIDIGVDMYTQVRAPAAGTVYNTGYDSGGGNMIEISHGGGVTTRYLHLYSIGVSPGDTVIQNQVIGLSGNSGIYTTGPHLHFEIRVNGTPVDPLSWLP